MALGQTSTSSEAEETATQALPDAQREPSPSAGEASSGAAAQGAKGGEAAVDAQLEEQVAKLLPKSTLEKVQDLKRSLPFEAISDSSESKSEPPSAEDVMQVAEREGGEEQNHYHPTSKGNAVHPIHHSWDMVVNIMLGIRMAIGRVMVGANRDLAPGDYTVKEKFTVVLPRPPTEKGAKEDLRFVDYAPMVFRKLRELWGVSAEEYMSSIGPQQILRGGQRRRETQGTSLWGRFRR